MCGGAIVIVGVGIPPECRHVFHVKRSELGKPLDAQAFRRITGASLEQTDRLHALLAVLERWQKRINLVGATTLEDPWRRHVLDSAQLAPLLPPNSPRVADLGSGAGFPGLVLAILTDARVTLVDSDARKCAFVAEAARVTGSCVRIVNARIESSGRADFDVVTARALARLPVLLEYASKWLAPNGCCLLLKGRDGASELTEALKTWKMRTATWPSRSDPAGMVLIIENLARQ